MIRRVRESVGSDTRGGILQSLQLDLLGACEPVPRRQHDIEGLCAKALGCERLRHVHDISESKIRQAAANVILDVAVNTLPQMDSIPGEVLMYSAINRGRAT
jgi:hypothetical protein